MCSQTHTHTQLAVIVVDCSVLPFCDCSAKTPATTFTADTSFPTGATCAADTSVTKGYFTTDATLLAQL